MICWVDGAEEQLGQARLQIFTAQPSEGELDKEGQLSVLGSNEVTDTRSR